MRNQADTLQKLEKDISNELRGGAFKSKPKWKKSQNQGVEILRRKRVYLKYIFRWWEYIAHGYFREKRPRNPKLFNKFWYLKKYKLYY